MYLHASNDTYITSPEMSKRFWYKIQSSSKEYQKINEKKVHHHKINK